MKKKEGVVIDAPVITTITLLVFVLLMYASYQLYLKETKYNIDNNGYVINVDPENWYLLNDTEGVHTTYKDSFKYDIYGLKNSYTPFEILVEYGREPRHTNIDLYEMLVTQAELVGIDIEKEFTGGELIKERNNVTYTYRDDEYTVYAKVKRDKYLNIIMVLLISPYTDLYDEYGKDVIDTISISYEMAHIPDLDVISIPNYIGEIFGDISSLIETEEELRELEDYWNDDYIDDTDNSKKEIVSIKTDTEGMYELENDLFLNNSDEFSTLSLPIMNQETDKLYAYISVPIPNNIVKYSKAMTYIFADTQDNISLFIDTYNYTGPIKDKEDYLQLRMQGRLDEAEYKGENLELVYNDNNSLVIFYMIYEKSNYLIFKFNEEVCVYYTITYETTSENAHEHVLKLLEQMNINLTKV